MIGEAARDEAYGGGDEKGGVPGSRRRKWKLLYSGVFVLLKKRLVDSTGERNGLCQCISRGTVGQGLARSAV